MHYTFRFRLSAFGFFPSLLVVAGCCWHASNPAQEGNVPMSIQITSTGFAHNQAIPKKYSGEGDDISPAPAWTNIPEGTQELALICDDPERAHARALGALGDLQYSGGGEGLAGRSGPARNNWRRRRGRCRGRTRGPSRTNRLPGPDAAAGHGTHHYHFTGMRSGARSTPDRG